MSVGRCRHVSKHHFWVKVAGRPFCYTIELHHSPTKTLLLQQKSWKKSQVLTFFNILFTWSFQLGAFSGPASKVGQGALVEIGEGSIGASHFGKAIDFTIQNGLVEERREVFAWSQHHPTGKSWYQNGLREKPIYPTLLRCYLSCWWKRLQIGINAL